MICQTGVLFWVTWYNSSRLAVAACMSGETAIFRMCCKEALCLPLHVYSNGAILSIYYKEAPSSLLLHASVARPQFSVYIIKKLVARSCCMHEGQDRNSLYML